jgi:hypothetical protein
VLGAADGTRGTASTTGRDTFSLSLLLMWKLSRRRARDSILVLRLTFWILLSGSSPRADVVVLHGMSLWEWSSWMSSSTHGRGRKVVAMFLKYYHRKPPK